MQIKNEKFINRELSWLRFNSRVLQQCKRDIPLFEKLKFLAIYTTNLDEFYMIRVAGLKQLFTAGVSISGNDQMTPLEQLVEIRQYLKEEQNNLERYYQEVIKELKQANFFILDYKQLSSTYKKIANAFFFEHIFPIIVPIAINATHPFPQLNNLSFSLAVKLRDKSKSDVIKFGLIRISRILPMFIKLEENVYVTIESLVKQHAEEIFPGYELLSSAAFKITRNADIIIEEEEADDLMLILEQGLKLRKKGVFVRMQIEKGADEELVDFLNSHMKIFKKDIYEYGIPLTLGSLFEITANKNFTEFSFPLYAAKTLPPFEEHLSSFQSMDKEDVLLYHPYESFDPVTKLVKDAAKDKKVISIRMTLYRVEKQSEIIFSLIEAANEGKQVTVMVELKARFDEENNLHWAKELENAGAHVIYGITGFKVHAKVCQIIRKVNDSLKFYMHFSTGNYNASSAKIYTDVSYFTTKEIFAKDTTTFFHILSGYNKNRTLNHLSMSPMQIKARLLEMIKIEEGKKDQGRIIAKMNALVDSDIINALYNASKAGVKIDLIVRGICCLRPKMPEFSENIRVISIVGRYLEHARIFYFKHSESKFYISSADWMPRNLERRFELMTPIQDEALQSKLQNILNVQISDNELAYELGSDGEYSKISSDEKQKSVNSQEFLENYLNKYYKSIKKNNTEKNINLLVSKLFNES